MLITIIGDASSGTWKCLQGVLAKTGVIYGIPFYASTMLRSDPASDTITTIGDAGSRTCKYSSAVCRPTMV